MAESKPTRRPANFKDLTKSPPFGRLTVVAYDGARGKPKPRGYWRCECSCGSGVVVITQTANLTSGNTTSCGCLRRENMSKSEGKKAPDIPGEHRTLPAYPGYIFTSDGDVWSCWTTGPGNHMSLVYYKLSPGWTDAGYLNVNLLGEHRLVHQVILEAFVGPCPEGLECRHLNGNPADNRSSNLKWGTRAENIEDEKKHGKMTPERREEISSRKLDADGAREIFALRAQGFTCTVISERTGVSPSMVSMIGTGRCWSHATGHHDT
jgi:hypothetical protein